ncbi:MAG: hypothetical protein K2O29_03585, partial [Ruminococcus sp.]|nr:hypothetical protein [Ruminococcus sp.]
YYNTFVRKNIDHIAYICKNAVFFVFTEALYVKIYQNIKNPVLYSVKYIDIDEMTYCLFLTNKSQ